MAPASLKKRSRAQTIHRGIQLAFLLWSMISLSWLANSVRTQNVADELLRSSNDVTVLHRTTTLDFLPRKRHAASALVFICGSGIHPEAYAPLLRPIADLGYPVFTIKLPYRFAPLDSHKSQAVTRARKVISGHPEITHWVIAGHSLGGALAARVARTTGGLHTAFVLIGTTHPKEDDLTGIDAPFTKIYATNDGVAPVDRVMASRALLPKETNWVRIPGGNHSQFGHYGHQLFDGEATITREAQQAITREALLEALRGKAIATQPFLHPGQKNLSPQMSP